jgi:hypothetical protein
MNTRYTLALDAAAWFLGLIEATPYRLDYIAERADRAYETVYAATVERYLAADHTDEPEVLYKGGSTYIHGIGTPERAAFHARAEAYEAARDSAREAAQRVIVYEALAAE